MPERALGMWIGAEIGWQINALREHVEGHFGGTGEGLAEFGGEERLIRPLWGHLLHVVEKDSFPFSIFDGEGGAQRRMRRFSRNYFIFPATNSQFTRFQKCSKYFGRRLR